MRIKSLFLSLIASISVFTFLSLPILREMYGDTVLLAVYGGLGVLAGIFVYFAIKKVQNLTFDTESQIEDLEESTRDDTKDSGNEVVESEMETLRNE